MQRHITAQMRVSSLFTAVHTLNPYSGMSHAGAGSDACVCTCARTVLDSIKWWGQTVDPVSVGSVHADSILGMTCSVGRTERMWRGSVDLRL